MANTVGNSTSHLDTALAGYQEELSKRIKAATSKKAATAQSYGSVLDQLQNKTCMYLKVKATKELYLNLNQCIAIAAQKESELTKDGVEEIIKKSEELKSQLSILSKTLKTLRAEAISIKEQACNLVDCCLEKDLHENPDVYEELCTIPDFETKLENIKQKGESAYSMADLTFCAAVNISGIQSFANIDSLKSYSENLVTTVIDLKKNTEENCTDLDSSIETTIEERTELVNEMVISNFANTDACCEEQAQCNTWNTSCDKCNKSKDHPKKGKMRLNEICEKFKEDVQGEIPEVPKMSKSKTSGNKPEF